MKQLKTHVTDIITCTYSFERSLNDQKNFLQKQNFGYIWNQGASKIRLVTKKFEVFDDLKRKKMAISSQARSLREKFHVAKNGSRNAR